MDKICIVCGKPFQIKPSHADKRVTCSMACMAKLYREKLKGEDNPHWRGGDVKKICPKCGREFSVAPSAKNSRKYCSRKCAWEARTKGNSCRICGKPIYTNRLYCPECNPRKNLRRSLEGKPQRFQHHFCKLCGLRIPYSRIYCEVCTPRGKSTITSYCQICGKPFEHWKGYSRKFCSRQCYARQQQGEGNSNWKGGRLTLAQLIRQCDKNRKLIAQVLKRDKYTCQLCGVIGGDLEVDHIKPFADILEEFLQKYVVLDLQTFQSELFLIALKYKPFWNRKNLRTLCRKCNWQRQVERNKIAEILR